MAEWKGEATTGKPKVRIEMVNYHTACDTSIPLLTACERLNKIPDLDATFECIPHKQPQDPKHPSVSLTAPATADIVYTDRRVQPVPFHASLSAAQHVNRIPAMDLFTLKAPFARLLKAYDQHLLRTGSGGGGGGNAASSASSSSSSSSASASSASSSSSSTAAGAAGAAAAAAADGATAASASASAAAGEEQVDAKQVASEAELPPWGGSPATATSICARTFVIPDDLPLMESLVSRGVRFVPSTVQPGKVAQFFICKPSCGSSGRGIQVVHGLDAVLAMYRESEAEPLEKRDPDFDGQWVIQEYISTPMLYDGRKFDMRVYLLLVGDGCVLASPHPPVGAAAAAAAAATAPSGSASASGAAAAAAATPVQFASRCRAFVMKPGVARLCSTAYTPVTAENSAVPTMHIANDSIQFRAGKTMPEILRPLEHIVAWRAQNKRVQAPVARYGTDTHVPNSFDGEEEEEEVDKASEAKDHQQQHEKEKEKKNPGEQQSSAAGHAAGMTREERLALRAAEDRTWGAIAAVAGKLAAALQHNSRANYLTQLRQQQQQQQQQASAAAASASSAAAASPGKRSAAEAALPAPPEPQLKHRTASGAAAATAAAAAASSSSASSTSSSTSSAAAPAAAASSSSFPLVQLARHHHERCFQLIGLDLMLDASGRCWLMEVNAKPCMEWNEPDDPVRPCMPCEPVISSEAIALSLRIGRRAGVRRNTATSSSSSHNVASSSSSSSSSSSRSAAPAAGAGAGAKGPKEMEDAEEAEDLVSWEVGLRGVRERVVPVEVPVLGGYAH